MVPPAARRLPIHATRRQYVARRRNRRSAQPQHRRQARTLKRLDKTYRDVSGAAGRNEIIARKNWDLFNKKLSAEIQEAQSFLEANRRQVSDEDYNRLNIQLGGQKQFQNTTVLGNTAYIREQGIQIRNDLNLWTNASAVNPGIAEVVRNETLLQKPGFVSEGEKRQIERLNKELEVSNIRLNMLQQQVKANIGAGAILADADMDKAKREKTIAAFQGKGVKDLIATSSDKKADAAEILTELSKQSVAQIDRQQMQIRNQLEELADNRLQRHFQDAAQKAQASRPVAKAKSPSRTTSRASTSQRGRRTPDESYGGRAVVMNGEQEEGRRLARGPVVARGGAPGEARGFAIAAGADSRPAEPPALGDILATASFGGARGTSTAASDAGQLYVAKGTYSLPVTLPDGEIRLDFARSAGQAQLTVWAVPQTTIRNLYATAVVLIALLIALTIVKIWPANRPSISLKRAIVYLILLIALTLLAWILGLIVGIIIIFTVEVLRAQAATKKINPSPN